MPLMIVNINKQEKDAFHKKKRSRSRSSFTASSSTFGALTTYNITISKSLHAQQKQTNNYKRAWDLFIFLLLIFWSINNLSLCTKQSASTSYLIWSKTIAFYKQVGTTVFGIFYLLKNHHVLHLLSMLGMWLCGLLPIETLEPIVAYNQVTRSVDTELGQLSQQERRTVDAIVKARVDKSTQAAHAGAAGMILCNDLSTGDEIIADPYILPTTHLTYADCLRLFAYLNSTKAFHRQSNMGSLRNVANESMDSGCQRVKALKNGISKVYDTFIVINMNINILGENVTPTR
ncbi:peptidase S8, subtilisin-related protein [Artemisia annua]|uniref:Peptidase S8, subtilisin-related protein n=1 Tax=Artemisia annua TaxID=35608 RepID=A0A2U1MJN6_ARTAN|nr:peptidase S8, subtilisin-related protein [Artemisia annua]